MKLCAGRSAAPCRCRLVALDLRGHGHTTCEPETDLSADTLAQDATAAWQQLFGAEAPATVLLGHSMGGAVAVRAAASKVCLMLSSMLALPGLCGHTLLLQPAGLARQAMACALLLQEITSLEGLIVIDVVEGTALASLPHMTSVLNQRPGKFASVEHMLQWALRSGGLGS